MMKVFAADDSRISFEGKLSNTSLFEMQGSSHEETGALRRATVAPLLDYVVLPLTSMGIHKIEKAIDSKIAFHGSKGIIHVQIESQGEIAFAAYDNFSRDCVVVTSKVPTAVLDELVNAQVLRGYILVTE
jgi:hypothetical protein